MEAGASASGSQEGEVWGEAGREAEADRAPCRSAWRAAADCGSACRPCRPGTPAPASSRSGSSHWIRCRPTRDASLGGWRRALEAGSEAEKGGARICPLSDPQACDASVTMSSFFGGISGESGDFRGISGQVSGGGRGEDRRGLEEEASHLRSWILRPSAGGEQERRGNLENLS